MALIGLSLQAAKDAIGQERSFNTFNMYDNRIIRGTIVGVVTSQVARTVSDVVNYNEQVIKSNSTDNGDDNYYEGNNIDTLDFILVKHLTAAGSEMVAYAIQWISEITWTEVETGKGDAHLKLFNVNIEDIDNVIAHLSNNFNIAAKIVKV